MSILMALINCPECDREISEKAPVCPGCGYAVLKPVPDPPKPEIDPSQKGDDNEAPCPGCGKLNWSKPQIKSFNVSGAIKRFSKVCFILWIVSFFIGISSEWLLVIALVDAIFHCFQSGKNIIEITCLSCGKVLRKN